MSDYGSVGDPASELHGLLTTGAVGGALQQYLTATLGALGLGYWHVGAGGTCWQMGGWAARWLWPSVCSNCCALQMTAPQASRA